jgi:cytochrome o ubiquinol oxidase operon protein cyoD
MSEAPQSSPKREHGTTASYIVGFLLSLVFTAVPYYMVVHASASGNTLLVTILGFAVLQMIIQIVFFLHLGRGPKPFYNVVFFISTIGIILVVVGGSMFIMHNLHYNMAPADDLSKKVAEGEAIYQVGGEKTGACHGVNANHKVTISKGKVSPGNTTAHLCDTLTFINEDNTVYIAFGEHLKHTPYGGEEEVTVRKGRPKTMTLNQTGTYQFHDHLNPDTAGEFTVTPE